MESVQSESKIFGALCIAKTSLISVRLSMFKALTNVSSHALIQTLGRVSSLLNHMLFFFCSISPPLSLFPSIRDISSLISHAKYTECHVFRSMQYAGSYQSPFWLGNSKSAHDYSKERVVLYVCSCGTRYILLIIFCLYFRYTVFSGDFSFYRTAHFFFATREKEPHANLESLFQRKISYYNRPRTCKKRSSKIHFFRKEELRERSCEIFN